MSWVCRAIDLCRDVPAKKGTPGPCADKGNRDRVISLAGHPGISERLGEQEARK